MKGLISACVLLIGFASTAFATDGVITEDNLNRVLLKMVNNLPRVAAMPSAPCALSAQPTPAPQVKVYQCSATVPAGTESLFATDRATIEFSEDNDNAGLGLIKSGDDMNFTHAFNLRYLQPLGNDKTLLVSMRSALFTTKAQIDQNAFNEVNELLSTGMVDKAHFVEQTGRRKHPIQFVDSERILAELESGKSFYYRLGAGVEVRETEMKKSALAAQTQKGWHGLSEKNIQYIYLGAQGVPTEIKVADGSAEVTPGYEPNEKLKSLSKMSVLATAAAGTRQNIAGVCEMQFEAGGFLSTEGKQVVGPNSYVHVKGDVKSAVFRMKDGSPRVNLGVGTQMLYFPTADKSEGTRIGFKSNAIIESFHKVGKGGNQLKPFLVITAPTGRQEYTSLNNDHEKYFTMGLSFIFK